MSAALGAALGAFVGVWALHVVRCVARAIEAWRFARGLRACAVDPSRYPKPESLWSWVRYYLVQGPEVWR